MPTSVLWKRDHTPTWGDQSLERGLAQWGIQVSPIEAKFLFRGLMYSTVAVPVDPDSNSMEEGAVLRLAQNPDGTWGVPIFTNPQMLMTFAVARGWTTPDKEVPWTAVSGKEAFKVLSEIEGVECWVNPGSSSLRLDQKSLKMLSDGQIPDPRTLGAARRSVSGNVDVSRPKEIQSALATVPDRVVSALRLTMEQYPCIVSATLYNQPGGQMSLGLKTPDTRTPEVDKAVQALSRMLANASVPISVLVLSPEMQAMIGKSVPPFYWRKL